MTVRRRRRGRTLSAVLCAVGLISGCTPSVPHQDVATAPSVSPQTGCSTPASTVRPTVSDPATRARLASVLDSFARRAWNPDAPAVRPSTLTGGLYINYRPTFDGRTDAAAQTNVATDGLSDDDAQRAARHDPLTDLAVLRDIDAAAAAGIRTAATERLRCLLQPVVSAEFADYGPARGAVYSQLTDLAGLDPEGPWQQEAHRFARTLAATFSDPVLLGRTQSKSQVRPDWVAESAAALVDAGSRFDVPDWTALGRQLADALIAATANPRTGLFPGQVQVDAAGTATVTDPLVRAGAHAQLLDGLLSVAERTGDARARDAVARGLAAMDSPQIGLVDTAHGGWFFAVDVTGGDVRTAYKETRSAWMLPLLAHAQQAGLPVPTGSAQATARLVRDAMYSPSSGGYVYRLEPDWTVYRDPGRSAPVAENWVTAEATGIAVDVLLGDLS